MIRRTLIAAIALALFVTSPVVEALPEDPPMTDYLVNLHEAHAHRVHVQLEAAGLQGEHVDLALPVWTPGSYLVREYSRHVLSLRARTPDGRPLAVEKTAKNTWRVTLEGADTLVADYELYANELSVRTNHADADHTLIAPAATFLRVRGREAQPHRVRVDAPAGWETFTGLPREGEAFVASDYDVLVDSPLEVGPHTAYPFEVQGVPHRLVIAGAAEVDTDKLVADLTAVSEEVATIFGQVPFDDYTVILVITDGQGGGLEHLNSNVSMVSRWAFRDDDRYRSLLGLLAHEYFHAWNVKRFRPAALGPFDYDAEVYTGDLWVCEGITSYYDDLSILRAGYAANVGAYLAARAKAFQNEDDRPGSSRMSLLQSSRDAWIKLYRPDENSTNSSISYYSKGALVALMLDLRLQRLSEGRVRLADVLRLGWERYAARGVGFPEGAVEQLAEDALGQPLTDFFDAYVRGVAPLRPNEDLAWVGLELTRMAGDNARKLPTDEDGTPLEPWLGVTIRPADGLARVNTVYEDSPAFRAGLNHDDLILAVDDMRVRADNLQDRLDRRAEQPSVTLTIYRGESLRTLEVEPAHRRVETWSIGALEGADEDARARFAAWTNWDHPAVDDGGWRGEDGAGED